MTTQWLDRPPTAEEVRAHAEAHQFRSQEYLYQDYGLWLAHCERVGPCILPLRLNPTGHVESAEQSAEDWDVTRDGESWRWTPLTAEGLPVPAACYSHKEPTTCAAHGVVATVCTQCFLGVRPALGALHRLAATADRGEAGHQLLKVIDEMVPEEDRPTDLERRLLAAWRVSGVPLGRLLSRALDCYSACPPADLELGGDDVLVRFAERWVRKHPRGKGGR